MLSYSIQMGEEFAMEFMQERHSGIKQGYASRNASLSSSTKVKFTAALVIKFYHVPVMGNLAHTKKYQLPGEVLDALVSISCDEDLHNMTEACRNGGYSFSLVMIWRNAQYGLRSVEGDSEIQYVVAVNVMDLGTRKKTQFQQVRLRTSWMEFWRVHPALMHLVHSHIQSKNCVTERIASSCLPLPSRWEDKCSFVCCSQVVTEGRKNVEDDDFYTSSGPFISVSGDYEADPNNFSCLEPSVLLQQDFCSDRIPREQAQVNCLSKSDDSSGSQFLTSQAHSDYSQMIREAVDNIHDGNVCPQADQSVTSANPRFEDHTIVMDGLAEFENYKGYAEIDISNISEERLESTEQKSQLKEISVESPADEEATVLDHPTAKGPTRPTSYVQPAVSVSTSEWGSKGLQLSIQLCNQLVQLLWLMLGQTSILPRTSDRNNLDIGSDYMKSPVKDDENARVEQHLQERKLNMKNTCLPLVFHSHGEFDTSTLQTVEFWREADILSKLHHPNVLAFYGVVHDGPEGTVATVT
ncbi:hypothetical protein F3Y22_tig00110482pilonHSYRG00848 [Hibiscus syriacus]|uniref:Protein kinase domain-containing protein n=1 Tax=Hibiscus syriacus TaxID=106335 RepID=A0A6A3AG49_HIBSY|nr:hypothetical protein F3Y22_tig00110482pilonHSYRG00848 [Hibiscus syriacus]